MNFLETENLQVRFFSQSETVEAVKQFNFSVEEGECVGLIGESGAGKSTVAKALLGVLPAAALWQGQIRYDSLRCMPGKMDAFQEIRGKMATMIGQDALASLDPLQTIQKQLGEVVKRTDNLSKKKQKLRVAELLVQVGLPNPEINGKRYPHQLSGGMRQRVLIAMALACRPRLLVADEPTSALDVTIQAQILQLLQNIQKETGMSILLITHDIGVAASICDRLTVLYGGVVEEQGPTKSIIQAPRHPYTKGLLQAALALSGQNKKLFSIPGDGSLAFLQKGCPFAPRCPKVAPVCFESLPDLEGGDSHSQRCFFAE